MCDYIRKHNKGIQITAEKNYIIKKIVEHDDKCSFVN